MIGCMAGSEQLCDEADGLVLHSPPEESCFLCDPMDNTLLPQGAVDCLLGSASLPCDDLSPQMEEQLLVRLIWRAGEGLQAPSPWDGSFAFGVSDAMAQVVSRGIYDTVVPSGVAAVLRLAASKLLDAVQTGEADAGLAKNLSGGILQSLGDVLARYVGDSDLGFPGCNFLEDAAAAKDKVSEALLSGLSPGDSLLVGSQDLRLLLSAIDDSIDSAAGFTVQISNPDEVNGGGNRRLRHRRALRAASVDAAPEIQIPSTLMDMCRARPAICPTPIWLELSYTRDSTYLLEGLGSAAFVSAAARFAGVGEDGLVVHLVSGQLGIRLPSLLLDANHHGSSEWSLLNSTMVLHLPLDNQVRASMALHPPSNKQPFNSTALMFIAFC